MLTARETSEQYNSYILLGLRRLNCLLVVVEKLSSLSYVVVMIVVVVLILIPPAVVSCCYIYCGFDFPLIVVIIVVLLFVLRFGVEECPCLLLVSLF